MELAFEDLEMPGQHLPAPDAPEQVGSGGSLGTLSSWVTIWVTIHLTPPRCLC